MFITISSIFPGRLVAGSPKWYCRPAFRSRNGPVSGTRESNFSSISRTISDITLLSSRFIRRVAYQNPPNLVSHIDPFAVAPAEYEHPLVVYSLFETLLAPRMVVLVRPATT